MSSRRGKPGTGMVPNRNRSKENHMTDSSQMSGDPTAVPQGSNAPGPGNAPGMNTPQSGGAGTAPQTGSAATDKAAADARAESDKKAQEQQAADQQAALDELLKTPVAVIGAPGSVFTISG